MECGSYLCLYVCGVRHNVGTNCIKHKYRHIVFERDDLLVKATKKYFTLTHRLLNIYEKACINHYWEGTSLRVQHLQIQFVYQSLIISEIVYCC